MYCGCCTLSRAVHSLSCTGRLGVAEDGALYSGDIRVWDVQVLGPQLDHLHDVCISVFNVLLVVDPLLILQVTMHLLVYPLLLLPQLLLHILLFRTSKFLVILNGCMAR